MLQSRLVEMKLIEQSNKIQMCPPLPLLEFFEGLKNGKKKKKTNTFLHHLVKKFVYDKCIRFLTW